MALRTDISSGASTGAIIGSIIPGVGTGIGTIVGGALSGIISIFGDGEDTSTIGYQNFINGSKALQVYPTKAEMLAAAADGGWNAGQTQAIRDTYSQADGTITQGDWHARVISINPIKVEWFKGANEHGITDSHIVSAQAAAFNAKGSNNLANLVTPGATSYSFGGSSTDSQPASGGPGGSGGSGSGSSNVLWYVVGGVVALFLLVILLFTRKR